jgi:hypothetical protein
MFSAGATPMTAAHFTRPSAGSSGRPAAPPRHKTSRPIPLAPILLAGLALAGVAFTAYLLWPRWPASDAAREAPSLPVVVGGTAFNIPRAAIRMAVQQRAGVQERLDLAFLWPSLAPPDAALPTVTYDPRDPLQDAKPSERVFVTISAAGETLPPAERVRTIYPRYISSDPVAGPDGLAVLPFRDDTPYRGEDLIYDAATAQRFLVRCSREGVTPGTCLLNRRIGGADVVARFPREWLADWTTVAGLLEQLIRSLRPAGG